MTFPKHDDVIVSRKQKSEVQEVGQGMLATWTVQSVNPGGECSDIRNFCNRPLIMKANENCGRECRVGRLWLNSRSHRRGKKRYVRINPVKHSGLRKHSRRMMLHILFTSRTLARHPDSVTVLYIAAVSIHMY